jgi:hypothetical protein
MEVLHIAVPVRSGLDANTQRPDVSNKYMKYTVLYTILIQTLRLRTCNSMRIGVYTTNTQASTRSETRSNITPRPIAPAARRGGALRPPGERLLCMIVLRCDRAGAKTCRYL